MTVQGPGRNYVLVKVVADDGLYGIAEAYGTPAIGVKEQILGMKPGLLSKDPLEIDTIYTFLDEHLFERPSAHEYRWAGAARRIHEGEGHSRSQ